MGCGPDIGHVGTGGKQHCTFVPNVYALGDIDPDGHRVAFAVPADTGAASPIYKKALQEISKEHKFG